MEDVDGGAQGRMKGALGEGGLFINSFKHQKWIKMVMIHVTLPKTNSSHLQ